MHFLLFIAMKIPLAIETISILIIDVGTDLAPAVSLAYEEPEDATMAVPPRPAHAHLVGPAMMMVAYGTIGMIQNFAAFFAFLYVFYDYGFTIRSLVGAGIEYRTDWTDLNNERQGFFRRMCEDNQYYLDRHSAADRCQQPFVDYRIDVLKYAQGAFLLTVVWSQIANVLIRKTQLASIFTYDRLFKNTAMGYSILSEIAIILIIVYLGEKGFEMKTNSLYASTALWVIPLLLIWDEVRKWIARSYPDGWVRKWTVF